jgi:hypothetical protein
MNDDELDQVLNRWKTPGPSRGLRARVLAGFPRRERLSFFRRPETPLRWAAALVAVLCMLAIGAAQSGGGTLENLGDGISRLHDSAINWIGDMWVGVPLQTSDQGAIGNHQRQAHQGVDAYDSVCIGGGRGGDSGVSARACPTIAQR